MQLLSRVERDDFDRWMTSESTESTGHVPKRLMASTVDYYANPDTHAGRLVDAWWNLGGTDGCASHQLNWYDYLTSPPRVFREGQG